MPFGTAKIHRAKITLKQLVIEKKNSVVKFVFGKYIGMFR